MIKIDKNVPMPTIPAQTRYPLSTMEVGDSFFAEGKTPQNMSNSLYVRKPKRFVARKEIVDDVVGVRVWRVL